MIKTYCAPVFEFNGILYKTKEQAAKAELRQQIEKLFHREYPGYFDGRISMYELMDKIDSISELMENYKVACST